MSKSESWRIGERCYLSHQMLQFRERGTNEAGLTFYAALAWRSAWLAILLLVCRLRVSPTVGVGVSASRTLAFIRKGA
jgi:hypothetical protein